jgi:hypothetical protein
MGVVMGPLILFDELDGFIGDDGLSALEGLFAGFGFDPLDLRSACI